MLPLLIRPLLTVWREDLAGVWVAGIPATSLPLSQGNTAPEALDATTDAIVLHLKHCRRRGILLRVLWHAVVDVVDDKLEDYQLSRTMRPLYNDVAERLGRM